MEYVINFLISLGASIVAILVVLWIERQRRPVLLITTGESGEIKEDDPLKRPPVKWLNVYIHNKSMPRWLLWVYEREPAKTCLAWITFHHYPDGHRVFDREMIARWNETPQPEFVFSETEQGQVGLLRNPIQNSVDIPPGEYTDIAVVVKPKDQDECFGWNNDSYLHQWKHPEWELQKKRYIAKVRVKTMGREFTEAFLITNDVPYKDVRLEPLTDEKLKRNLR
jgi:hypothetical protein